MNDKTPSRPPVCAHSVIRSRRRTLALEITGDGDIVVRAPHRTPDSVIEGMIRKKEDWIARKVAEIRARPTPAPHEYVEGEMFLFLGGSYPLTFTDDGGCTIERLDRLYVPRSMAPGIRSSLKRWYMQEAQKIVQERCAYFSMVAGYDPASIDVTDARRRWGSCTSEGRINFSWRLVQAPLRIVDYVVVHELVHLRQPDHSAKFWRKVESVLPDYRERRAWLRGNEWLLKI
ncbi:MAG TPA: SprT family zinc-dependent metalloprotease [Methanoregulaceae archaeon]|nr:SprT family zinc-dependent metalloprotease [Methanoregulaceae archaeon]